MKSLSNYTESKQTELFNRLGAFFAFSKKQLDESKIDGVIYVSLVSGLIVPKVNVMEMIDSLALINVEGIKQDKAENGKINIIKRELYNYECFYTGEIDDCIEALSDYEITVDDIRHVYDEICAESTACA